MNHSKSEFVRSNLTKVEKEISIIESQYTDVRNIEGKARYRRCHQFKTYDSEHKGT
jgi:hypothetical protein